MRTDRHVEVESYRGSMDTQRDDTSKPHTEADTTSDPSLDDETGSDWSGEGGAVPDGPATDPEDGEPRAD